MSIQVKDQRQTFDKEKSQFNIARIKKGGELFEVAIDPDKAIEYKAGKLISVEEVIRSQTIFSNVTRGLKASEQHMAELFKTTDSVKVAEIILKEGELQLTEEYRRQKREERRKRVLELIHRNAIDPKTGLPHPMTRLENAFEEAKIKIDEHHSAEEQMEGIVRLLRPILPIKFETLEIEILIPAKYASKTFPLAKKYGTTSKESWNADGSVLFMIELPAGLQEDFFDILNKHTHGDIQSKIIRKK